MSETTEVLYLHRYEYRTQDENGKWSEPEIRYHNPTSTEERAKHRHMECKDFISSFGRKFDGIYGYSWKNCELVKRTTYTSVEEEKVS